MQPSVKLPLLVVALAIVAKAQWVHVPGSLIHISANVNYVWGVNRANQILMCQRPCTGGNWTEMDGLLKQLDVDDHEVWGVDSADQIWKRPVDGSGTWQQVGGLLSKHVSASGHGYVWGVNRNDRIFKCKKPCLGDWVRVPGALQQIDGGQRNVYGVNPANGRILTRPVDGSGSWRRIPGSLKHISASGHDEVFRVNSNIVRCKKPCVGEFELVGGSLTQCDATVDGVFGVNSVDIIFRHDIPLE